MTAQASELTAVVARLEKVERQNRRLRRAGIAVLVLAAAGLLMGQATPKARIVEAEGFFLKDEKGNIRALLGVNKVGPGLEGPGLGLFDEKGKLRALLAVGKEGPGLALFDKDDKPRIGLGIMVKDVPVLYLSDENGKVRARLGVNKAGPELYVSDENGKPRAGLAVVKAGPVLRLSDENGKTIWSTP